MTTLPKYTVAVTTNVPNCGITPAIWRVRARGPIPGYGKPNRANLQRYIAQFNASLEAGGANAHLREQWPNFAITSGTIIVQESGEELVYVEA